ncbi:hypothetical protein HNQ60_005363 [Povalibacter uvarum]|uniref:Uncharacterized protein n=1 Tax=Povalibacter uvarum TaxID=732238 RepID=A0A841HSS0_9GAMM|nr:hypothetical protein [Povalibacter uvarum]MBB6096441.1 hypothetical protein [Povalibacter uvarum]
MKYLLCCSAGNTVGIDEYVSYSEIDEEGYWCRYLEINANGRALRYSTDRAADKFGVLPEGKWDEAEGSKSEYGVGCHISRELFDAAWQSVRCING